MTALHRLTDEAHAKERRLRNEAEASRYGITRQILLAAADVHGGYHRALRAALQSADHDTPASSGARRED